MHARVCVCMKCVGGGGHEHVWPIPASSRRPARQPCQGPAALCVPRLVIAVAPCVCSATGQVPCYLPTGGSPCCPSCSSSAPLAPTHPHLHSMTHLPAATHSTDKRRHPERQGPAAGQHRALTHVQHRAAGQLGRRPGTAPATTLRGGGLREEEADDLPPHHVVPPRGRAGADITGGAGGAHQAGSAGRAGKLQQEA